MNKLKSNEILNELHLIIPNPKCELEFNNVFELTIAVTLSAQTTDKRVNEITKILFSKYPSPYLLGNASFGDVYEIIKPLGLANSKTKNIISISNVSNVVEKVMKFCILFTFNLCDIYTYKILSYFVCS